MKVQRCRTCGKLGVGPHAVKLYPFEDHLYCREDFRGALQWHEQRGHVTSGIESMNEFMLEIARNGSPLLKRSIQTRWEPYIRDLSGLAGWALEVGDRRTFVHYFARALYAWELREA